MLEGILPHAETNKSTAPTSAQNTLGKDDFMKLMIAQLSNQNPLNPMDGQEFSAQLAQFSALEQMTNVNTNIQKLIDSQQAATNSSMINMIGKQVDVQGNSVAHEAEQTHNLNYALTGHADTVTVDVYDALGQLVRTLSGTGGEGNNTALWDGLDQSGNAVNPGNYTFTVKAIDPSGNSVDSQTFTKGSVSEVLFEEDGTYAIVNGQKISSDSISRVSL
ncbi:flagellar hook assembly protein FlgD [Nitrospina watsonii]|uniref:Basal-body rod modification protein FlgD n=1 Tax=Nitrospina watsonii TaxID=1323948 RepID=A0ABN8VSH8_9BACT|nr:flagellar hook capping FlgD N-terminal domain-containing protein [Nitrospina watsonii]CAI2716892.1 Flagellar basal-body rod modification protein FlgD [Nitrospina watsonii]